MCLAVPGRVLEIVDAERKIATVDVAGVCRNVNLGLLEGDQEPAPGDYVLVHLGFALSRLGEEEAMETLRMLEDLGQGSADESEQLKESSIG